MNRLILVAVVALAFAPSVFAQACGQLAVNPVTGKLDCIGPIGVGTGNVSAAAPLTSGNVVGGSGSTNVADGGFALSDIARLSTTQTFTGDKSFTGKFNASGASSAFPFQVGATASLPATCTAGQTYFASDATAGSNIYLCTSTNTWTQLTGPAGGNPPATAAITSGVTTSVTIALNTTMRSTADAVPSCVDGSGVGQGVDTWTNTTTQMTITFSPTAAFSGTCTAVLTGSGSTGGGGGSGTVTSSGTPAAHQIAIFTTSTDVKGVGVGATDKPLVGATGADPVFSKLTLTNPATAATLTIANNKTFTVNNTLTFSGTDSSSVAFGGGGTVLYSGGALGTPSSGTLTNATGLPLSGHTSQAADTVVMNATGGSAAPTAVAMPTSGTNGCAGTSNALTYNTSTHALGCNTISGSGTVNSGTANNFAYYATSTTAVSDSGKAIPTGAVVGTTDAQTLSSKTLTSPKVTTITDGNGNPFIISSATGSAVDSITVTNAATANPATVKIGATGSDTNVNLELDSKGSGKLLLGSSSATVDSSGNAVFASVVSGTSPPSVTAGTGGVDAWAEGTAPSVGIGALIDLCYGDSTAHGLLCSFNNDTASKLARASDNLSAFASTTSAQLRSVLSDEVGTGAAYFVGGALGTPASATLTNATGLPLAGLATQAADTVVMNASGSSASPTAVAMPTTGTNGCAGTSNALTYNTTTHALGCNTISGSGNTTSTSLTSGTVPKANGANSIIDSAITDNGTTAGLGSNFTVTESTGIPAKIAGITTTGMGAPVIGWKSQATSQTTNQNVTLATSPTAGFYVLDFYANQNGSCSGSASLTFSWTDSGGSKTLTTGSLNSGATYLSGTIPLTVSSGNVTYTSTVSSCTYDINVILKREI